MLGLNYIEIDGKAYTPSSFNYQLAPIENVFQSEAGTDIVLSSRLDKHKFYVSWQGVNDSILDEIENMCTKTIVELKYRNKTYTCRAREFTPELMPKTYKYRRSDGLWNISCTLTEI